MYLARNQAGPRRYHYVLRESYADGDLFRSRDLADLGPDPGTLFVYTGETSFHIDETLVRRLGELGVTASYTELEDLLFPFLDPYLKARLQPFRDRHRHRGWRPAGAALRRRALEETHAVDRRRLHFLRLGRTSAETVDKTAALYTVLLDKSRDEIEQLIHAREQALPPREIQQYLFAAFDLERFFAESYARSMPQALDRGRLDELFVEEVCRLAADPDFWRGYPRSGRLPEPLVRYLILYFDTTPDEPVRFARFDRSSRARRFHRTAYADTGRMSRQQAAQLFGLDGDRLASLSRRELIRLYRRKAHELHPDKGGDTDRFVRLTAAYEELLSSLP